MSDLRGSSLQDLSTDEERAAAVERIKELSKGDKQQQQQAGGKGLGLLKSVGQRLRDASQTRQQKKFVFLNSLNHLLCIPVSTKSG